MTFSRLTTLAFATVALTPLLGFAQKAPSPKVPAPTSAPAPVVVGPWANKFFLPDIAANPGLIPPPSIKHDFGTVPHGTLSTHKFTITNIYDVPIQVIDVRVECGCLKAYPPNKMLAPNETTDFVVTMNAAMFKGKQSKAMFVTFGPNFVSTAELRFEATSREDINLEAPGEIDFGTVAQGSKTSKTLTIKYSGGKRGWEITGAQPVKGAYDIEVKEMTRGPLVGLQYYVRATLKEDAQPGDLADTISLKTNDPNTPLVTVNVRGYVVAPLTVSPGKVNFNDVKLGETKTFKILVKASDNCTLTPVPEDADGFSIETFAVDSKLHTVTVKLNAKKEGAFKKELKLTSSLPGKPSAIVTVEATVGK